MKPYSPIPRFVSGQDHAGLIHRLIRKDVDVNTQRIDLITTTRMRLSVIDSGHSPVDQIAEGDTCIHILWQANESDAHIVIGGDQHAIAPGDFTWIPAGDTWHLSRNQLAILIAVRSSSLAVPIEPTHGENQFNGHNRQSIAPSAAHITPARWKITEPLSLPASGRDRVLVGLWSDIALQHEKGVYMLHQGRASVIRPETGQITLVPNGLSYVLVID